MISGTLLDRAHASALYHASCLSASSFQLRIPIDISISEEVILFSNFFRPVHIHFSFEYLKELSMLSFPEIMSSVLYVLSSSSRQPDRYKAPIGDVLVFRLTWFSKR
ncbi:hypothetical protein PNOK_0012000 [Pyrrhoderma noxium]|uniref:Uncharacterized protein n=1 Tax=Pyrrhoderma noxium TaxID=2282107 RepID=A0A286UTX4_9AGAM|nr:hypothetical protein PNOK_0012000 [Pyrrhoderma noxium]